ncbi:hypothetical protein [Hyphomicrobium sp.]|uniref:hypothetical protein n=1 Tax=Hyphomicrobium sp. TaxID=82 RepID=UPI0025C6A6AC|nr:hypothetical protein [Hyphomicrobium sp.]
MLDDHAIVLLEDPAFARLFDDNAFATVDFDLFALAAHRFEPAFCVSRREWLAWLAEVGRLRRLAVRIVERPIFAARIPSTELLLRAVRIVDERPIAGVVASSVWPLVLSLIPSAELLLRAVRIVDDRPIVGAAGTGIWSLISSAELLLLVPLVFLFVSTGIAELVVEVLRFGVGQLLGLLLRVHLLRFDECIRIAVRLVTAKLLARSIRARFPIPPSDRPVLPLLLLLPLLGLLAAVLPAAILLTAVLLTLLHPILLTAVLLTLLHAILLTTILLTPRAAILTAAIFVAAAPLIVVLAPVVAVVARPLLLIVGSNECRRCGHCCQKRCSSQDRLSGRFHVVSSDYCCVPV